METFDVIGRIRRKIRLKTTIHVSIVRERRKIRLVLLEIIIFTVIIATSLLKFIVRSRYFELSFKK
jgi:hypothetical protein